MEDNKTMPNVNTYFVSGRPEQGIASTNEPPSNTIKASMLPVGKERPANPVTDDIFVDTHLTPVQVIRYNGTAWTDLGGVATPSVDANLLNMFLEGHEYITGYLPPPPYPQLQADQHIPIYMFPGQIYAAITGTAVAITLPHGSVKTALKMHFAASDTGLSRVRN